MGEEVSEALKAEIRRYSSVLERLRAVSLSKQQLQAQLLEIKEALEELEKAQEEDKVYKIIGRIMISTPRDRVKKELQEKKDAIETRLMTLQKQEALLKKQLEDLERRIARKMGGASGAPSKTAG